MNWNWSERWLLFWKQELTKYWNNCADLGVWKKESRWLLWGMGCVPPETLLSTFCSIVWEQNQGSSSHAGLCCHQAASALCFTFQWCVHISVSGLDEIFHLQSLAGLSLRPPCKCKCSYLLFFPTFKSKAYQLEQRSDIQPCKNTKYSDLIENNYSPGQKC